MRRPITVLIPAVFLSFAFVALTPGRALIDRALFPDETTLGAGLAETIALVQDTVAVAEGASSADLEFALDHGRDALENADPTQAGELSNNYSLSDHSNQARYPGYNDCDAWRNAFDDGWSASYMLVSAAAHLSEEQRRLALDAVREHWEISGYRIETLPAGQPDASSPGYSVETDFGRISFVFDPAAGAFSIQGTTKCLPPG